MPSYHVSSSGKVVKCASDPCHLHSGGDFQAKNAEEAEQIGQKVIAEQYSTQIGAGLSQNSAKTSKNGEKTAETSQNQALQQPKPSKNTALMNEIADFNKNFNKTLQTNKEYAELSQKLAAASKKQASASNEYEKAKTQADETSQKYAESRSRRKTMLSELKAKISKKLSKDPEMLKLKASSAQKFDIEVVKNVIKNKEYVKAAEKEDAARKASNSAYEYFIGEAKTRLNEANTKVSNLTAEKNAVKSKLKNKAMGQLKQDSEMLKLVTALKHGKN